MSAGGAETASTGGDARARARRDIPVIALVAAGIVGLFAWVAVTTDDPRTMARDGRAYVVGGDEGAVAARAPAGAAVPAVGTGCALSRDSTVRVLGRDPAHGILVAVGDVPGPRPGACPTGSLAFAPATAPRHWREAEGGVDPALARGIAAAADRIAPPTRDGVAR